jgi:hypothetical protein
MNRQVAPAAAVSNVRAEEAVLGKIILDHHAYRSIEGLLRAEHFTVPHHRQIFEAVRECHDQKKQPSLALLEAKLPQFFEGAGDVEAVLQVLIEKAADGVSPTDFVDELVATLEARESARQIGPKRIHLIPFDRIKPTKRPRGLIKGLLSREGLIVVWGPPKCMKTFVVLDWCFHIALGWSYRGRRVTQGPVVYCGFEGQAELPARVEAFRRHRLQGEAAMSSVPFFFQPVTLDLVRDHTLLIAAISATLIRTPPVAVVLDTLNRSLRGSESSDEDMGAYVRAADAIRDAFACAVLVVHHSGIDTNRPRGHTSLTGAADVQLSVRRDGDDRIIVKIDAAKDMLAGVELVSTFETVEVGVDEDGDPVTSCVIVEADGQPDRPSPARRLPPKAFAALRGLRNCTAELGVLAPPGSRAPAGTKGVTTQQWRDELKKAGVINAEGNYRQEFIRLRVTLQNTATIGIWEEFVWPVT